MQGQIKKYQGPLNYFYHVQIKLAAVVSVRT